MYLLGVRLEVGQGETIALYYSNDIIIYNIFTFTYINSISIIPFFVGRDVNI